MRRQKQPNQPEESFLCPATPKNVASTRVPASRIAEASPNAEITRTFVDLAHSWTRLALELESAQALLVAVEDMENAGWVGPSRDTIPTIKKGRPPN